MYETYWGLERSPFRREIDPEQLFHSGTHDEAFARLEYLVEEGRRLGLLLGASGCGKSLFLDAFSRQQRRAGSRVACVNLLGMDAHEFLWSLANQFGSFPKTTDSMLSLWQGVSDQIAESRYQQIRTVLLLDDADDAENDCLTQIVRVAHCNWSPGAWLSIVLAAETKRYDLLGPRLLELTELRVDLEPWEFADTVRYFQQVDTRSGRADAIFTVDAMQTLYDLSGGLPRRVNQLADLCLLAGAGNKLYQIDADTVEAVFHELDVHGEKTVGR